MSTRALETRWAGSVGWMTCSHDYNHNSKLSFVVMSRTCWDCEQFLKEWHVWFFSIIDLSRAATKSLQSRLAMSTDFHRWTLSWHGRFCYWFCSCLRLFAIASVFSFCDDDEVLLLILFMFTFVCHCQCVFILWWRFWAASESSKFQWVTDPRSTSGWTGIIINKSHYD